MGDFAFEYKRLNARQKEAVDTLEGPVMVVAGPGTGKTQLLTMRVANLLRKTDALPSNILCLTFSESGERAMRERLVQLIGQPGYQVPVYTFHSFGADIMNRYPEYFYRGAEYRSADELKQYEILQSIFAVLEHNHTLGGYLDDKYTQLKATQAKIKEFKQAGFTPELIRRILDQNDAFMETAEPLLDKAVGGNTLTAKDVPALKQVLDKLETYDVPEYVVDFVEPLATLFTHALGEALADSLALSGREAGKPLTKWKNAWRDSAHKGVWRFAARGEQAKLRAVVDVYEQYQAGLQSQHLYDYDDMIMQVLTRLESTPELQSSLQEQYLYILVDEYQDTNQAQLRLVRALADHPVHEGKPNLMVVGDDDQGIYKFQGADLSNMLEFMRHYPGAVVVTLTDNYRSPQNLLDAARGIIQQGTNRLEGRHEGIDKTLVARVQNVLTGRLEQPVFYDSRSQYQWVAANIAELIRLGMPPGEIAVLGRQHQELQEFTAYLRKLEIPVDYEKCENILESPHIQRLLQFCRLVVALSKEQFDEADSLLPEVLSYEFWELPARQIWKLSLEAYKQREPWFAVMEASDDERIQEIYDVLAYASAAARTEPLEMMLDILIGAPDPTGADEDVPRSPYFAYYFGHAAQDPAQAPYLPLLDQLVTLRRHLRNYLPDQRLYLEDILTFAQLHKERGSGIISSHAPAHARQAVHVMTAHKAKGLEFEAVFILSCLETVWGQPKRAHRKLIKYPPNLPLEPAGDDSDDWLRLFYVALTRAKQAVFLCVYNTEPTGEAALPLSFLGFETASTLIKRIEVGQVPAESLVEQLLTDWRHHHYLALVDQANDLSEHLKYYKLSATHLDNFLDVEHGGPQFFFLRNLLQFPQAMRANLAYGSAIHAALSAAHGQVNDSGRLTDPGAILAAFRHELHGERMSKEAQARALQRGEEALQLILSKHPDMFRPGQISERGFGGLPGVIENARLSGKLDLIEVKDGDVTVTDYKTGRSSGRWSLEGQIREGKLYKYRRQLLFYKLLLESSGDIEFKHKQVKRGRLVFVEPNKEGELVELAYDIDREELARLQALIPVVWQHIMDLNFPDVSQYEKTVKGVRRFEDDLLQGKL